MKPAITVDNLSKLYRINLQNGSLGQNDLRETLTNLFKAPLHRLCHGASHTMHTEEFWALKDVSFEVYPGEVLGVIGRNGAGKSTLLKILSRITDPTSGTARIRGRVSSLLEVGTGFHPELTGRENVYLNGAILGMTRAEIRKKFDEIVAFSGIDKFLDTPVKRYSSGMRVRLGFAVAAHLEPEILIIDEVLAVGDYAFQEKCIGKMRDVASHGRTVVFVSHSMGAVAGLCDRCIALTDGKITDEGNTREVIEKYLETAAVEARIDLTNWNVDRSGEGPMRVTYFELRDQDDQIQATFDYGETIRCRIGIDGPVGQGCIIGVSIRDSHGQVVLHPNNIDDGTRIILPRTHCAVEMELCQNVLNDGRYYVTVWLGDELNVAHDRVGNCVSFVVQSVANGAARSKGAVRLPARWVVH